MDSGELPPGERLPTIRQLEKDYGVAQQTVQHAFKLLRQEGRIVSWQGRGTFVVEPNSQPNHGDDDYQQILDQLTALEDNQHRIEQRMGELEATVARLQHGSS